MVFDLDKEESAGTRKYFNIIGLIYEAAIEGKVIILDELDARLHTLLSYSLIKMFNSFLLLIKTSTSSICESFNNCCSTP